MKTALYTRVSKHVGLSHDQQREVILAKFGNTHEIIGEYRDGSSQEVEDRPGLKTMLEDPARDKFDVPLCTQIIVT